MRDDGLTRLDIMHAIPGCHTKKTPQHNRVFVKLWRLAWFNPARRALHPRYAYSSGIRIDMAHEFLDYLRHIARRLDHGWRLNEFRHSVHSFLEEKAYLPRINTDGHG
jgi:hypothetical protein